MRGLLILGALAALAALSTWFLWTVEATLDSSNNAKADQAPSLLVDRFVATRMNALGVRQYTLTSPHLVQLPGAEGTQLERPVMEMFQEDGRTREWLIEAEQGWLASDNKLIRLERKVSLTRPATSGKLPVVIDTHDVLIHADTKIVETSAPARLETPNGVLEGVGLKARLNEKRIELLSKVRGTYAPPKS